MRRRFGDEGLAVKMWAFPGLTIAAGIGIVAVLLQMGLQERHPVAAAAEPALVGGRGRPLLRDPLAGRLGVPEELESTGGEREPARKIVVLANQTMAENELHDALEQIEGSDQASYFVVVPANPVDTGQADREGAAFVWQATTEAAQQRLDLTLAGSLRSRGLSVEGELGDYRPLVALDKAMNEFGPDDVVIATRPEEHSTWLRHGVVADARERYEDARIQHVVVHAPVAT